MDKRMKTISNFILERLKIDKDNKPGNVGPSSGIDKSTIKTSNKEAYFMGKTSKRTQDAFSFVPGEKVLLIKYSTHRYKAQLRGVYEIDKIKKNNIELKHNDEFYKSLKFDICGIFVKKQKNKYLGNSTDYWVLYNKELSNDKDLTELLSTGSCSWHFSLEDDEDVEELKNYIKEVEQG